MSLLNPAVTRFVYVVETTGELLRCRDGRIMQEDINCVPFNPWLIAQRRAANYSAMDGKQYTATEYKPNPAYPLV